MRKLAITWISWARGADPRWRTALTASVLLHLTTLALVAGFSVAVSSTQPQGRVDSGWTAPPADPGLVSTVPLAITGAEDVGSALAPGGASRDFFAVATEIDAQSGRRTRVGPPTVAAAPQNQWFEDADYRSRLTEDVGSFPAGGDGSGFGGAAGGDGNGNGRGAGRFFGVESEAQRVVFVVDCSRSMNQPQPGEVKTRFKRLQLELLRAVAAMDDDDEFFIVFFNDRPIPMPATSLQRATREARRHYLQWMAQMRADGETDPREALALALRLRPDVVFFLTDGDFPRGVERDLLSLTQRQTAIHTIAFGNREAEKLLEAMAAANRGRYRFVP